LVTDVGVIEEEDPPPDRVDLSDVSFNQVALLIVAFPVMIVVQLIDLIVSLAQFCERYVKFRLRERKELLEKRAKLKAAKLQEKTRGSSVSNRIIRTLKRHFKCFCAICCGRNKKAGPGGALDNILDDIPASPYAKKPSLGIGFSLESPVPAAPKNAEEREVAERKAREAAQGEEDRKAAAKAAEVKARLEAEATR